MLKCIVCGADNDDGTQRCTFCGASLEKAVNIEADSDTSSGHEVLDDRIPEDTFLELTEYTYSTMLDNDNEPYLYSDNGSNNGPMGKEPVIISEATEIGRSSGTVNNYFADDKYMGNPQCRIYKSSGKWYIEAISDTNPTRIGTIKLQSVKSSSGNDADIYALEIKSGDWLQLADRLFYARIKKKTKKRYYVICPRCREMIQIENPDMHLEKCPNCGSTRVAEAGVKTEEYT